MYRAQDSRGGEGTMEKHGVVCVRYVRIEDRALDDPSGS